MLHCEVICVVGKTWQRLYFLYLGLDTSDQTTSCAWTEQDYTDLPRQSLSPVLSIKKSQLIPCFFHGQALVTLTSLWLFRSGGGRAACKYHRQGHLEETSGAIKRPEWKADKTRRDETLKCWVVRTGTLNRACGHVFTLDSIIMCFSLMNCNLHRAFHFMCR